MQSSKLFTASLLIFGFLTPAHSFDGHRQGFVLGGGMGPSLNTYSFSDDSGSYPRENKMGLVFHQFIGYGFTSQFQVLFYAGLNRIPANHAGKVFNDNNGAVQGVNDFSVGISSRIYLTSDSLFFRSPYFTFGIGHDLWSTEGGHSALAMRAGEASGPVFSAGLGYEFLKHLDLQWDVSYAHDSQDFVRGGFLSDGNWAYDVKSFSFQLKLIAIAY